MIFIGNVFNFAKHPLHLFTLKLDQDTVSTFHRNLSHLRWTLQKRI